MTETLGEWESRTGLERLADEIESLPEIAEPATTTVEAVGVEPVVLMERSYAGLLVELRYGGDEVSILVRKGEEKPLTAVVPPEAALDAFNHPYCYLTA